MKTTQQSLSAVGKAPWLNVDYYQTPPAVTLAGFISSGAVLTWAVQYTCDPLGSEAQRPVGISQTTTVITVTDVGTPQMGNGHGLSVGDYVNIFGTGVAGVDGEYSVTTVVSATQYTVTSGTSQSVTNSSGSVISARVFTHATLTGQTVRQTGNFAFPVRACRLQVTAYTSGVATLEIIQGGLSS